ncbi:MAG TPA: diadenylate cyclase CdaA [Nitrospiria bacterium]|nr:diadenylate cyclase CdaA [Nitrospiria bacterium]
MWDEIAAVITNLRWQDVLDMAIVAAVLYWLFLILKGTRALQMLIGLGLLLVASLISKWAELTTVDWLVTNFWAQIVLVIVILFQPEIRRVLAQIGQTTPLSRALSVSEESRTLEEIIRASVSLANKRIGAIIVLERESELKDIVEMGVALEARVSKELLTSIFMTASPLHDGAVVIKENRIIAAGCFLPLSLNPDVSKMLGTRHRAALGVTEETDAVVIALSEETGAISVIIGGKMTRELDAGGLRRVLTRIFLRERRERLPWMERLKGFFPIRSRS